MTRKFGFLPEVAIVSEMTPARKTSTMLCQNSRVALTVLSEDTGEWKSRVMQTWEGRLIFTTPIGCHRIILSSGSGARHRRVEGIRKLSSTIIGKALLDE